MKIFGKQLHQDNKQRFSFKKYRFGLASVLIGFTFLGGGVVQADNIVSSQPLETTYQTVNTSDEQAKELIPDNIENRVIPEVVNPMIYLSEAQSISVDDYKNTGATKQEVTVEGYITGVLSSATAYGNVNTNLALGSTPTAEAKDTVPVQLPAGDIRTQYNIKDNPTYIGKKNRITGNSEDYFKK